MLLENLNMVLATCDWINSLLTSYYMDTVSAWSKFDARGSLKCSQLELNKCSVA